MRSVRVRGYNRMVCLKGHSQVSTGVGGGGGGGPRVQ